MPNSVVVRRRVVRWVYTMSLGEFAFAARCFSPTYYRGSNLGYRNIQFIVTSSTQGSPNDRRCQGSLISLTRVNDLHSGLFQARRLADTIRYC